MIRKRNRNKEQDRKTYEKYYAEHHDEILEKAKRYYYAHREQDNARARKYHAEHREEIKVTTAKYRSEHRERMNEQSREYHIKNREEQLSKMVLRAKLIRDKVIEHYGGRCACPNCSESNPKFLTVDHINGDGAKHRKQIGNTNLYRWIIKNNFPDNFQLLCWNCNIGRYHNGDVCPHMEMTDEST